MKKFLISLLILCCLTSGCGKKGSYTEITLYECLEKFKNDETFVVLLTREACEVCENSEPVFKKVVNDLGVEAYNVFFTVRWLFGMDGTNSNAFYELLEYVGNDIPEYSEGFDVPVAFYVKEGKIIYHIMGYDFDDVENITKEEQDYQYALYAKGFTLLQ